MGMDIFMEDYDTDSCFLVLSIGHISGLSIQDTRGRGNASAQQAGDLSLHSNKIVQG
jgi:hypothetical protein